MQVPKQYETVFVKPSHIREGIPRSLNKCAISLAIKEQFDVEYISVVNDKMYLDGQVFCLPEIAREFIQKSHKSTKGLEPFEFRLLKFYLISDPKYYNIYD